MCEEELPAGLFSLQLDSSLEEVGNPSTSAEDSGTRAKCQRTGAGLGLSGGGMQHDVPGVSVGCTPDGHEEGMLWMVGPARPVEPHPEDDQRWLDCPRPGRG